MSRGLQQQEWALALALPSTPCCPPHERDTTCIKVSLHYTSVGMWKEAKLSHLISPELAPDGTG